MNSLRKLTLMALRSFAVTAAWCVGCSPSEHDPVTDRKKDDETCIQAPQPPLPKRELSKEDLDRVREIEVALAMWYSCQALAASQLERHEGVEFGPITFERDPQVIITEQGRNVSLVEGLDETKCGQVKRSMAFWREQQLEAANLLRHALGKADLPSVDENDSTSFLRQQTDDLVALKKYAKEILGYDYWPSRSADRGIGDGMKE